MSLAQFAFIGVAGAGAAAAGYAPITASADWGTQSGASAQTSPTRTLTVPVGNPGSLNVAVTQQSGSGAAAEYSKNGGAFTSITVGTTTNLAVANNDTFAFRVTGAASRVTFECADSTTTTDIGTADITTS